jgi:hypothetical protein
MYSKQRNGCNCSRAKENGLTQFASKMHFNLNIRFKLINHPLRPPTEYAIDITDLSVLQRRPSRPLRHRCPCCSHLALCATPSSSAPAASTPVTSTRQPPALCVHCALMLPPHPPSVRRRPAPRCQRAPHHWQTHR